jgi:hypothetical protein
MNQLQEFINEQKTYYSHKLAEKHRVSIQDIRTAIKENKPVEWILLRIMSYGEHLTDIYCRLLLANLEGEILKIVKEIKDENNESSKLLDFWELPDNSPAQKIDNKQIKIGKKYNHTSDAAEIGTAE